jgi:hypothetical protein
VEEPETRSSLLARAGVAVGLTAVLIAAVYALVHFSTRPIHPQQKAPSGHPTYQCSLCHTVSEKAQLVER